MRKLFVVLSCAALLFVGLFYVNFVMPTTVQAKQRPTISAWDSVRAKQMKIHVIKELDIADAIKALPGIADVHVVVQQHSEWERNVWARRQDLSASILVKSSEDRPIGVDTVCLIGQMAAKMFGITDMSQISIVDAKFNRAYDGAGVETADGRPQVIADSAELDIGKFRLSIEYTLHNIPTESLIEFLTEEFLRVEAEAVEESGKISITASLADHRTIMKMLTKIEREVEALRSEAANGTEMVEQQIVMFPIRYESAENFLTQHQSSLNPSGCLQIAVDDHSHSLVVTGTTKQLAVVGELIQELNQPVLDTIYDFSPLSF